MPRSEEEILEEMLRWLRFTGLEDAKRVIDDALTFEDDERKQRDTRIAFEMMDGHHSQGDIGRRISYSRRTVGNWQEKWSKLGIVAENAETGYPEHLVSLDEFGLDCPPIPDPEDEESEADESDIEESDSEE